VRWCLTCTLNLCSACLAYVGEMVVSVAEVMTASEKRRMKVMALVKVFRVVCVVVILIL